MEWLVGGRLVTNEAENAGERATHTFLNEVAKLYYT